MTTVKQALTSCKKSLKHIADEMTIENIYNGISANNNDFSGLLNINNNILKLDISSNEAQESLAYEFKALAKGYRNSKETIVKVLLELVNILNYKYRIKIKLEKPAINNYANNIERQLFLLKFFHPSENHSIVDANDALWMYSEDRILKDIKEIRKGSLSFLGKKVENQLKIRGNDVLSESTAHPLVLVENLTQIIAILEGLKQQSKNPILSIYAKTSASTIWNQLSDYAKKRIVFVVGHLFNEDVTFYNNLNNQNKLFYSELEIGEYYSTTDLTTILKNGYPIRLALDSDENVFTKRCIIKHFKYDENNESRLIVCTAEDLDSGEIFSFTDKQIVFIDYEKKFAK